MIKLRAFEKSDIPEVEDFWKKEYRVSKRDDKDRMGVFIEKNAGLSTVAEDSGVIIGTTLGSYDGRKGYIQKVAVSNAYRGKGIGKMLVDETVKKLKDAGALDIRVGCGGELTPFYEKCGFKMETIVPMKIKNY